MLRYKLSFVKPVAVECCLAMLQPFYTRGGQVCPTHFGNVLGDCGNPYLVMEIMRWEISILHNKAM